MAREVVLDTLQQPFCFRGKPSRAQLPETPRLLSCQKSTRVLTEPFSMASRSFYLICINFFFLIFTGVELIYSAVSFQVYSKVIHLYT